MQVIKGFSKSSGYLLGDATCCNRWNTVFGAGGWRLVQTN